MPERIYKLQPNRTIQLRGFNDLGASAALHSATATGFEVSGIFRDPADFCVLTLYDADNFFEHPSLKYLPDTNFAGLTLSFDVYYTGLRNLDSPRFPILDWPYLDIIRPDGTTAAMPLFDPQGFVSGTWTAASGQFTVLDNGLKQWDHVTIWYLNRALDYIVPQIECAFAFTTQGAGFAHSITLAGTRYSYTEQSGDDGAAIAKGLSAAVAASTLVTAAPVASQVNLRAQPGDGHTFTVTSTAAGAAAQTLAAVGAASVAAELARQCNTTDWTKVGADIPLTAVAQGPVILFTAAKPGVDGNALALYAVSKNARLTTDQPLVQLTGGSSDATFHVNIDFTAATIPQVRKMWLTLAPPLSNGAPFTDTEWQAVFTNWTLAGPEEIRRLQVAGPGSLRIEENDSACSYTGAWTTEAGFYSYGYSTVSKQAGSTVTIAYESALTHDLWLDVRSCDE